MPLHRFFCAPVVLATAITLSTAGRGTAQVVIYDLASQWSDISNPNGVWRLQNAPGQLFPTNQSDYWSDGSGQPAWADLPYPQISHVPVWMKVATTRLAGFATVGTVVMHTAESGRTGTEFTSLTWTSPAPGTVHIAGGAWIEKNYDRPQQWELRLNGVSLTTGTLTQADSYTQATPFDFATGSGGASVMNLTVQANDVVELLFYRQSTSTYGDMIGLNFSVTFTAIPEPAVVRLLFAGIALLGLTASLRRNRAWLS